MSQTIDIFSRQVIENHSNMADNDILDLEYVPEKTSRLEKSCYRRLFRRGKTGSGFKRCDRERAIDHSRGRFHRIQFIV